MESNKIKPWQQTLPTTFKLLTSYIMERWKLQSHKTPILNARVQIANPNSNASVAVALTLMGRLSKVFLSLSRVGGGRFEGENFNHPFVPDFAVVRLSVHGYYYFAIIGDVEGSLV